MRCRWVVVPAYARFLCRQFASVHRDATRRERDVGCCRSTRVVMIMLCERKNNIHAWVSLALRCGKEYQTAGLAESTKSSNPRLVTTWQSCQPRTIDINMGPALPTQCGSVSRRRPGYAKINEMVTAATNRTPDYDEDQQSRRRCEFLCRQQGVGFLCFCCSAGVTHSNPRDYSATQCWRRFARVRPKYVCNVN